MSDWPMVVILLVTYKRTELATRVVRAIQQNLDYPNYGWVIADDGSPDGHVRAIVDAIGHEVALTNAARYGVGKSMNLGMAKALEYGDYILWLEDDWEVTKPVDLRPCVQLRKEREDVGMVRLAYISPGIRGELISGAGRLWWRLEKGPTYTFTGHASLRHRRFCETYGQYQTGLAPGETELYMCGTFNNRQGPGVVLPAWTGEWGPFAHIGTESLKNMKPEK